MASDPPSKRVKLNDESAPPSAFIESALSPSTATARHDEYVSAEPYKHCVVDSLFEDSLLKRVRDEVAMKPGDVEAGLGGLVGWGAKETDIYKINQSFDLSSLTSEHLDQARLDQLPALQELRDALYSSNFREWVQKVTGCGPLSQKKVDGSVSRYTKGCHLLLHDDVISTRRISWILYLPSEDWVPSWGGALELYPALKTSAKDALDQGDAATAATWRDEVGSDVVPTKVIHPRWGQFVFFEVQPGKSYHSVEEVVVQEGKERLSISGWFHKPVEGEFGHEPETGVAEKSSLEQITQKLVSSRSQPYEAPPILPETPLTAEEIAFLKPWLHPQYLQLKTLSALAAEFGDQSVLQLAKFLHPDVAGPLEEMLLAQDQKDGLLHKQRQETGLIPPMDAGVANSPGWEVVGPSTRQRYLDLVPSPSAAPTTEEPTATLHTLLTEVFPSSAFRAWLALLTAFVPLAHKIEARRFRPGLDYTLARGDDEEAHLDLRLGLTPGEAWEDREGGDKFGGWECYMAPPDEGEDPAVYQASKPAKAASSAAAIPNKGVPADHEDDSDDDEDDEAPLLTIQPSFNSLLLVLRDAKVMKFTKYVSACAPGSRWDIGGEWEINAVEEESAEA